MKVRMGFVSNSSSSSFILAVHKDHKVEELLQGAHPLVQEFAKPVVDFLSKADLRTAEEAVKLAYPYDGDSYAVDIYATCMDMLKGDEDESDWRFFIGSASDDEWYQGAIGELTICYGDYDHTDGWIRLWSEGGY